MKASVRIMRHEASRKALSLGGNHSLREAYPRAWRADPWKGNKDTWKPHRGSKR